MNIILNITRKLDTLLTGRYSGRGIDRVLLAYVRHYRERARVFIKYQGLNCLYSQKASTVLFDYLLEAIDNIHHTQYTKIIHTLLFQQNHQNLDGSVYLNLTQAIHDHGRFKQLNIPIVNMIHDLIPLRFPEYCGGEEVKKHARFLNHCLMDASGIITNSKSTLNDLYACRKNIDGACPPTLVAPLASGLANNILPLERPIHNPYFVMLSSIDRRKNYLLILQIWRRLVEHLGHQTPKLVLIGRRGSRYDHAFDFIDHCETIKPYIIEVSDCADQQLVTYLHHTQALLFPTFAEGYGLPLIEAMTHNTPVIASNLPVFYEIAGDVPEYLDPLDAMKWMEIIEAYCSSSSVLRHNQLDRLRTFQPPTWENHFEKVDAFLQKVIESTQKYSPSETV